VNEHILVVDDEQNIRRSLEIILRGAGLVVTSAASGEEGLTSVQAEEFTAVFLDMQLPGMDGIEVLRRLRSSHPDLPVVIISGHATIERAVEATRLGAFEFVEKPFSRERILLLARNAADAGRMKRELAQLRGEDADEFLGKSAPVQALREAIERVAPIDARVLILGESGTGKELVARALHRLSQRVGHAFIKVNCAAIPDDLIETELFGAVKGAYTSSVASREGRFAAADKGTLFLDEIGDMSMRAQSKVLRVLQEGEYEPVGSTRTVQVDVRVIAATHRNLRARVEEGLFREDLLFRLNVVPLEVPPLRERAGDIRLLGERFIAAYASRHDLPPPRLQEASWDLLERYAWPGNVRELKNVIERLVILRRGMVIRPEDLPYEISAVGVGPQSTGGRRVENTGEGDSRGVPTPYAHLSLKDARDALERDLIKAALAAHAGSVTRAAAQLGIERTHLHKRIRAMGLDQE
jgi:two-component system, NtrC family, nitrogen regulation response regulator NtrX